MYHPGDRTSCQDHPNNFLSDLRLKLYLYLASRRSPLYFLTLTEMSVPFPLVLIKNNTAKSFLWSRSVSMTLFPIYTAVQPRKHTYDTFSFHYRNPLNGTSWLIVHLHSRMYTCLLVSPEKLEIRTYPFRLGMHILFSCSFPLLYGLCSATCHLWVRIITIFVILVHNPSVKYTKENISPRL